MLEFNLLPDVKIEYLKAQRTKHLVVSGATVVTAVAVALFILLLLFVDVAQKKHLNDINKDIKTNTTQLSSNTNLNKILTIQNQLQSLPAIEAQNPVASRLFGYMAQLTPAKATVSTLNIDFGQHTATVTGGADSLGTVNQFVDTLKFTTYKAGSTSGTKAFSQVVLSSFGYTNGKANNGGSQPATYTVTFGFDPLIFDPANSVTLTVPQITSTRSILGQPTDLFQQNTTNQTGH